MLMGSIKFIDYTYDSICAMIRKYGIHLRVLMLFRGFYGICGIAKVIGENRLWSTIGRSCRKKIQEVIRIW